MLYKIGRFLQLAGMIILPVAAAGQALERMNLRDFLLVAGVGVGVFLLGWLLQEMGRPPS